MLEGVGMEMEEEETGQDLSVGDDHRGRQQGQRRDGSSSNDRDVEGADRNNNNQPLERAEGEAVAIKKIMGGVAGISTTMPRTSLSSSRRGRMGGGGGGRCTQRDNQPMTARQEMTTLFNG